jgi:membrane protease subunit HflK
MPWDWEKLQKQRQRRSGGPPPQMGEVFDKIKGIKGRFPGIWIIIIALILFYMGSSIFYTVGVDEVGVVQRFGKYARTTPPGLNFKLPRGIEKVTKVKARHVYKEEFGFRTLKAGVRTRYASGSAYLNESLMLTGDLNVAVVPWIVQYRINDPFKYLFKVRNVRPIKGDFLPLISSDIPFFCQIPVHAVTQNSDNSFLSFEPFCLIQSDMNIGAGGDARVTCPQK